jgi:ribonuclease E
MAEESTPTEPDEPQDAASGAEAPAAEEAAPAPAEQPAPEQPAAEEQPPAPEQAAAAEQPAEEQPAPAAEQQPARGQGKPRRDRPRRDRGQRPRRDRPPRQPQQQRASGPLPFQELRDAATALVDLFGARQALRDAFSSLGDKERRDLARLVAEDGDWRVRARNIAAGSLGAGRVGKALAAQQISMARVEDLWPLTLSKEEAAERQSRVRNARRRDERRAQRDAEREQRSDRVSRADLEKAQDGRVGAQIRIVIGGTSRDRRRKGDEEPKEEPKEGTGQDLLDRLGY